jgi:hypothetical protein
MVLILPLKTSADTINTGFIDIFLSQKAIQIKRANTRVAEPISVANRLQQSAIPTALE